jgi:poly(3-hydroxybutyrate) depolymerase
MKKHYKVNLLCKCILCLLVCLVFEHILLAQTQTQAKITKVIYRQSSNNAVIIGGYLESLPVSYTTDSTRKFPMIIFLHGSGEVGDGSQPALEDLENDASGSIPYKIAHGTFPASVTVDGKTFSFIVISPQFTTQNGSTVVPIKAMIDTAVKYYRVDTSRIYITGLSLGGYGEMHLLLIRNLLRVSKVRL